VLDEFAQRYHWSIMQAEYSTDIVFKSLHILGSLYQQLAREAVLSVFGYDAAGNPSTRTWANGRSVSRSTWARPRWRC
jgi:hypothetical protein